MVDSPTYLANVSNYYIIRGEGILESHQDNKDKDRNDADRRSSGAKIDLKMDLYDEEGGVIMSNFFILEVSGPPQVKCHSHFKKDKKKIAKCLKSILNSIYIKCPASFEEISKLKLYGVQLYSTYLYTYRYSVVY